jgi:phosphoribosylglycinamide formyltransferase 1
MAAPLRIAVLVSGTGSNMRALLDAIDGGRCAAEVTGVVADRHSASALIHARDRGVATHVVAARDYADRAAWDRDLAAQVAALAPELVVLAGFMRLVGDTMLSQFGGRLINVHPALLPAFPGIDAPAQAIAAGVTLSGCTVHLVDAGIDTGQVLAQAAVPVLGDDDASSLHARIQRAEHRLLPAVVHAIAVGTLQLGAKPRYAGSYPSERAQLVSPLILTD